MTAEKQAHLSTKSKLSEAEEDQKSSKKSASLIQQEKGRVINLKRELKEERE